MIVGLVTKVRPRPDGERIWLADVDIGRDYLLQIVWGGVPMVEEGSVVPVAPPGARLPDPRIGRQRYKMRRRRYRGEMSEGMLCSLAELGWDPIVTERVALLSDSMGLQPGDPLGKWADDWESIVKPVTDPIIGNKPLIPQGVASLA